MKKNDCLKNYEPAYMTPSLSLALIVLEAECKACGAQFSLHDGLVRVCIANERGAMAGIVDLNKRSERHALSRIDSIVDSLRSTFRAKPAPSNS